MTRPSNFYIVMHNCGAQWEYMLHHDAEFSEASDAIRKAYGTEPPLDQIIIWHVQDDTEPRDVTEDVLRTIYPEHIWDADDAADEAISIAREERWAAE